MNAWVRKHTLLFNFIDKKLKLKNEKYNLVSYKIYDIRTTDELFTKVIYCNINIHREVVFTDISINQYEYDKFLRKTKIEKIEKI